MSCKTYYIVKNTQNEFVINITDPTEFTYEDVVSINFSLQDLNRFNSVIED